MSSNELPVVTDGRSSTKLLAGVVLVVTFIAGAVIGLVGDRALLMTRSRMTPRGAQFIIDRLDRKLDLDDQQRARVTEIVRRHEARITSIWSAVRPQVRQEFDAANGEIEQVLTPEQRQKFEKMKLRMPQLRRGPGPMHRGR